MQFQPRRHPDCIARKATAYALEIVQQQSAGLTYEAIRDALAGVSTAPSTSTLRREVRPRRVRCALTKELTRRRERAHIRRPVAYAELQPAHRRRAVAAAGADSSRTSRSHAPKQLSSRHESSARAALTGA